MSPLFGKKDDKPRARFAVEAAPGLPQDDGTDAGSALDAEVSRLDALTLTQLAAEVMTGAMTKTNDLNQPVELYNIVRRLEFQRGLSDAAEADVRMRELIGEGIQVLEQARLVRLEGWQQGNRYQVGYVLTRLGRAALQQDAVERILDGGSL
jgi:hypothetical protein